MSVRVTHDVDGSALTSSELSKLIPIDGESDTLFRKQRAQELEPLVGLADGPRMVNITRHL